MEQVVLQNTKGMGFSIDALLAFRSLEGVSRVDARDLQENGRFSEVILSFREPGLASRFTELALEHFGDELERVE